MCSFELIVGKELSELAQTKKLKCKISYNAMLSLYTNKQKSTKRDTLPVGVVIVVGIDRYDHTDTDTGIILYIG